jgi:hypothetical protein
VINGDISLYDFPPLCGEKHEIIARANQNRIIPFFAIRGRDNVTASVNAANAAYHSLKWEKDFNKLTITIVPIRPVKLVHFF